MNMEQKSDGLLAPASLLGVYVEVAYTQTADMSMGC